MATLAKLVVKLVTDVSEFEAGMQASSKKLTKIGDEMTKVGGVLTAGVTLPILAADAAALKFASDLNDSTDMINEVFGKSSDVVEKFASTAAVNLGLSKSAAEQAAGGFGLFLTNMGVAQNKAADMSTKLVSLAVDLGELKNVDPSTMFAALQSALSGRGGELKKFGIILDDARIKEKALSMGIYSGVGAMDDATRATAAYQIILDETSKYQGFFASQTNDAGASMAKLKAVATDLGASFGQLLIPVAVKFMEALIPILQFLNNLPAPVKTFIVVLLVLAAALGPVILIAGQMITAFASIAGLFGAGGAMAGVGTFFSATLLPALAGLPALLAPIGAGFVAIGLPIIVLIAAIGLLIFTIIELGPAAWNTIKMIGGIFGMLPQLIGQKLDGVGNAISTWFKTTWDLIVNWVMMVVDKFGTLPQLIGQKLDMVGQAISTMLRNAWQTVMNWTRSFYQAGQALIVGFINGIISYAVNVVQTVMGVIQAVIDAVKKLLNLGSPSKVFAGIGRNMMLGLEEGVNKFSNQPISATVQTTGAVIQAVSGIRTGGAGGRSINVGPITIQGDLSPAQMASLEQRIHELFYGDIKTVLEGT
jgi:hypothetical protein